MSAQCQHCNDTGSLSKDIAGHLDCAYCDAARQRAELESWYVEVKKQHDVIDLLWLAFQRGRDSK
jgi:hypothetical protein